MKKCFSQSTFLPPGPRLRALCRGAPSHPLANQLWALKGVIFFLILSKPDSINEAPFNRSQFTKKGGKKNQTLSVIA